MAQNPFFGSPIKCQNRQKNYKFSTPPWKETYRKRCVENLRRNRQNFVERFRNDSRSAKSELPSLVESVMTEEWHVMREHNSSLPSHSEILFGVTEDEEINYYNSIMDEIQRSLKSEEEHLIEIYCEDYEQSLCADLASRASTDELICPVCQKSILHYNKGVIFCSCGVRLNTECDALSLSDLRRSLNLLRSEHDRQCAQTASYSVVNTFQVDNLIMTCESCDFMQVVL